MLLNEPIERTSVLDLHRLRQHGHANCMACMHPELKLDFTLDGPDRLRTSIDFTASMTSFNGMVHGGLQSFVIDEAMTCLLMGKKIYGATGELNLRYKAPVRVGPTAHIIVWIVSSYRRLHLIEAELHQEKRVRTRATARFMEQDLRRQGG